MLPLREEPPNERFLHGSSELFESSRSLRLPQTPPEGFSSRSRKHARDFYWEFTIGSEQTHSAASKFVFPFRSLHASLHHERTTTREYEERDRAVREGENLSNTGAAMLGLTEATADLDNLTEFNTAHNRRISMLGIGDEAENPPTRSKKKRKCITFSEEHELINPEDVDPSVGRFRNMIHSTVIPGKKQRYDPGLAPITSPTLKDGGHRPVHPQAVNLYSDLPHPHDGEKGSNPILSSVLASRLGIALPDPAPEVDMADTIPEAQRLRSEVAPGERTHEDQPSKKKIYAKEAWPGKKPLAPLLLVSSAPPTNFL
uniref:Nuclear inhibitor of protein phosphatase 1 n=1 Tax=Lygus hesperus TaxID=30085 RepID=A0A0A9XYE0_LYGHE